MSYPKPLQIYRLEDKEYKVDLNAINSVLEKVGDRRIAIYSINGPLSNDKSLILGFFLKYINCKGVNDWVNSELGSAFTIEGVSNQETIGIFMWSEPFITRKDNHEVALLLIDTQINFNNKIAIQDQAIVFALSIFLSSLVIFNIKERVSEQTLQFLRYSSGLARLAEGDNYDEPFQKLIFLLRDWQTSEYECGYYDEHSSIDGKNFKRDYLNVRVSQPDEVNDTHESILHAFTDVGCYLMPHLKPKAARNSNPDPNSFGPHFLQHLKNFILLVFRSENIIEKKIGGSYVSANDLKRFIEKWAKTFKNKEIPQSKSVFGMTTKWQSEMAKVAATEYYARKMKETIKSGENHGREHGELQDKHSQLLLESLQLFKSYRKLDDNEFESQYTSRILKEIQAQYQYFEQLNNGNLQIKDINEKMQEELDRSEEEKQENERKLQEIKVGNSVEKQRLLSIIEESNMNIESIKKGYLSKMRSIQREMERTRRELNEARFHRRGSSLQTFCSGVLDFFGL